MVSRKVWQQRSRDIFKGIERLRVQSHALHNSVRSIRSTTRRRNGRRRRSVVGSLMYSCTPRRMWKMTWLDESLYPDVDPPDALRSLADRIDFLARLCGAWDFGILPEAATVMDSTNFAVVIWSSHGSEVCVIACQAASISASGGVVAGRP